jgi:hypothetical protein
MHYSFERGGYLNYQDEFEKGMSYDEYVSLLSEHLNLHQLHYNKFSVDGDSQSVIKSLKPYKILVITEPWCGDSLALLPIIRKISELNTQWEIKILLRDSNPELMHHFLTHGSRGIPIFLFLDENGELQFKWGPRPKEAAQIFEDHREQIEEGKLERMDVIKKIRTYYAKDRGVTTLAELINIFEENEVHEAMDR